MIRVHRSVTVPKVLTSERANAERARVIDLLQSPPEKLEQLRITFDHSIYLGAREALLELFHNKCAYCETRVRGVQADLEHFRPKQGARAIETSKREHLYYAWLAYEWDNLLIACGNCNRRSKQGDQMLGKADYFPVAGPRAPMLSSVAKCREVEHALLIDPTFDDPAEHLLFDGETGLVSFKTEKGRVTISVLGLNREDLIHDRRQVWTAARSAYQALAIAIAAGNDEEIIRAREIVEHFQSPEQEHLAVARIAIDAGKETIGAALGQPQTSDIPSPAAPQTPRQYEKREELPPFAHERIRRIQIRNFKAIESLDFEIADPRTTEGNAGSLMLLGENASGKSSVLEAIALTLLGTKEISNLSLHAEDFIRRTDWEAPLSDAKPAEVNIFFERDTPVSLTIDPKTKKFLGNTAPATVLLGYGPRRFFADQSALRRLTERFVRVKASAQVQTLFDPLAVITNPNEWLITSSDSIFNPTVRALKQLLGLPDQALIERPKPKEKAEMMFEVQGNKAPLARLSEGYKTIVATGVDIMREMLRFWPELESAGGVVLIDEIETHLHPRWRMRIIDRLRKAMPQVQFITTTHDPLTLRGLYNGEVQVLARNAEFQIERLVDVPNVRGLSVEQLLTSDYFGLFSTEDPVIEEAMSRYVTLATKRDRTLADEHELEGHRQLAKDRLLVGSTPQSQVLYEAANEYLLQRRTRPSSARASLKKESIGKMVDFWKSIDAEETAE